MAVNLDNEFQQPIATMIKKMTTRSVPATPAAATSVPRRGRCIGSSIREKSKKDLEFTKSITCIKQHYMPGTNRLSASLRSRRLMPDAEFDLNVSDHSRRSIISDGSIHSRVSRGSHHSVPAEIGRNTSALKDKAYTTTATTVAAIAIEKSLLGKHHVGKSRSLSTDDIGDKFADSSTAEKAMRYTRTPAIHNLACANEALLRYHQRRKGN